MTGMKKMAKYFNAKFTDELSDILKFDMMNIPLQDEIYHYTSLTSLESILTKKQFWATESRFMNDAGETTYIENVVQNVIKKLTAERTEQKLIAFATFLLFQLKDNTSDRKLNWTYILSFSKTRDSLAMWNYYGKNDGYCIGLDFKKLQNKQFNSQSPKYTTLLFSVIYNEKEQIEIMEKEIRLSYEYYISNVSKEVPTISQIASTYEHDEYQYPNEKEYQFADVVIYRWKGYLSGMMKHPSFEPEQEVRMTFKIKDENDINYRVYQGIMAPYITVEDILLVKSIMIGPMIKHDQALIGLLNWLKQSNLEIDITDEDITQSSIPLRF